MAGSNPATKEDSGLLRRLAPRNGGFTASAAASPRQRRDHQCAIEPPLPARRFVQSQSRQAFGLSGLDPPPPSLPDQRGQTLWRALHLLQELQRRNQTLLDVREIAAERKERE